jgi:hypothetical protein
MQAASQETGFPDVEFWGKENEEEEKEIKSAAIFGGRIQAVCPRAVGAIDAADAIDRGCAL